MTAIAYRTSRWTPLSIAAVVLGFMAWWPVGLAVLAYIFWGGSIDQLASDALKWLRGLALPSRGSGNAAFDAYRERTLKRLEEEQAEFAAYVQKLREARDQDEFDRFMAERAKPADIN
jgi:hypothetical protein